MFPFAPQPDRGDRMPTEPEQVETVGELSDIELILGDKVLQHRAERFARMGFTPHQSRALALDKPVDTHWVESLRARSCPVDLAFDIASS